jgi:hypothetical protein
MSFRLRLCSASLVLVVAIGAPVVASTGVAAAQFALPPAPLSPALMPPLPSGPPPPKIEVPPVPRLGATLPTPNANPQQSGSFGDRVGRCLGEAAARGLGPSDRAAYSLSCAHRE